MTTRLLLEYRLVERAVARVAEHHVERHAHFEAVLAGQEPFERTVQLTGLDFGQVAEVAEVDAEHRDLPTADQRNAVQHRAVATQAHDEIDVGQCVARCHHERRVTVGPQPRTGFVRELRPAGAVGVDDEGDGGHA